MKMKCKHCGKAYREYDVRFNMEHYDREDDGSYNIVPKELIVKGDVRGECYRCECGKYLYLDRNPNDEVDYDEVYDLSEIKDKAVAIEQLKAWIRALYKKFSYEEALYRNAPEKAGVWLYTSEQADVLETELEELTEGSDFSVSEWRKKQMIEIRVEILKEHGIDIEE